MFDKTFKNIHKKAVAVFIQTKMYKSLYSYVSISANCMALKG